MVAVYYLPFSDWYSRIRSVSCPRTMSARLDDKDNLFKTLLRTFFDMRLSDALSDFESAPITSVINRFSSELKSLNN